MVTTDATTLLGIGNMSRIPWFLLGAGALLLSCTLLYFIMSRRGESKSVSKCVRLSVWAHLILIGCAYLTHWFPVPVGMPQGTGDVTVHWVADDPTGDDETPSSDASLDTSLAEQVEDTPSMTPPGPLPVPDPRSLTAEPNRVTSTSAHHSAQATDADFEEEASPVDADTNEVTIDRDDMPRLPGTEEVTGELMQASSDMVAKVPVELTATPVSQPPLIVDEPVPEAGLAQPTVSDPEAEYLFSSTDDPRSREGATELTVPRAAAAVAPAERPATDGPMPSVSSTATAAVQLPVRYQGRTVENRRKLAEARGGSLDTEAAVEAALTWIAQAQNPQDGRWDNRAWEGGWETRELGGITYGVQADTAVTGLALLAFLGAGQTHVEGNYQPHVRQGLEFLLRSQSNQTGSLAGDASPYVAMYCHGIATLALSEALIMTDDMQLRRALQRAVDYTIRCQHPVTGGWRYQPGGLGDTSQFGWQLMALVSAQSAGISIPEGVWHGAQRWMKRVELGTAGGLACYTPDRPIPSPSMTAEAMFCRPFLPGAPRQAAVDEAAEFIARHGARPDALSDLYFSYYATLALYPLQDQRWERWNQALTQHLLLSQQASGSLAGSWAPDTKWGPTGGRVYSTSMACLCLETYYRYLPVYELAAVRGRAIRQR